MAVGDYVTLTGLAIPTVEGLTEACANDQRALIDTTLNTDPDSPIGQLTGIFCSHLREAWEALLIAYYGFDPDKAEGDQLVGLSALTGTSPAGATKSKFIGSRKLTVNLNATTTIPIGVVFHVDGDPLTRFVTTEQKTSTTAGNYSVAAEAEEYGPIRCNAGTLTVIATPVVGLNSVTNDFDAIIGQNEDRDSDLRERRENELRATGKAAVDAIRAALLDIELEDESKPILSATVYENEEDITDVVTGLPPHSLECLVYDGPTPVCPDDTIAQTIWTAKGGGIKLVGNTSGTAVDSLGTNRTIPFSRPTILAMQFALELEIETSSYVGDAAVKTAIQSTFAAKVKPGKEIRCNDYVKTLMSLAGVIDVLGIQIEEVGGPLPPSGTNFTLAIREMGNVSTTDISITTTPGSP
jgi:uncharacterized phage protein gp47/JayE